MFRKSLIVAGVAAAISLAVPAAMARSAGF